MMTTPNASNQPPSFIEYPIPFDDDSVAVLPTLDKQSPEGDIVENTTLMEAVDPSTKSEFEELINWLNDADESDVNDVNGLLKSALHLYPIGVCVPGYQSSLRLYHGVKALESATARKMMVAHEHQMDDQRLVQCVLKDPQFLVWLRTKLYSDYLGHSFHEDTNQPDHSSIYCPSSPLLPKSMLNPLSDHIDADLLADSPLLFMLLSTEVVEERLDSSQQPTEKENDLLKFVVASLLRQRGGGVLDENAQRIQMLSVKFLLHYLRSNVSDIVNQDPPHSVADLVFIGLSSALMLNFQVGLGDTSDLGFWSQILFPRLPHVARVMVLLSFLKYSYRVLDVQHTIDVLECLKTEHSDDDAASHLQRMAIVNDLNRAMQYFQSPTSLLLDMDLARPDRSDQSPSNIMNLMVSEVSALLSRMVMQGHESNNTMLKSFSTTFLIAAKANYSVSDDITAMDSAWKLHPHTPYLINDTELCSDPIVAAAIDDTSMQPDMQPDMPVYQQMPMTQQQPPMPMAQQTPPMPMTQQQPPMAQQTPPMPMVQQQPPMPMAQQTPHMPMVQQQPPMPMVQQQPPMPMVQQPPPMPTTPLQPPMPMAQQQPHMPMVQQQPPMPMAQQPPPMPMAQQPPPMPMAQQPPSIPMVQQQPQMPVTPQQPPIQPVPLQRTVSEIQRLYGINKATSDAEPDSSNPGLAHALGLTDAKETMQGLTSFFSKGLNKLRQKSDSQDFDLPDPLPPVPVNYGGIVTSYRGVNHTPVLHDPADDIPPFAHFMSGGMASAEHHASQETVSAPSAQYPPPPGMSTYANEHPIHYE